MVALALAGCTGGENDSGDSDDASVASGSESAPRDGVDAYADAPAELAQDESVERASAGGDTAEREEPAVDTGLEPGRGTALVKTGRVSLRADDVDQTAFRVREILAGVNGQIGEERTEGNDEDGTSRTLLVLRVPVDTFDEVYDDLREIEGSTVVDSKADTEDVTTEVIDVDVRIAVQERSIDRISALLDRAGSLRGIVAIERELSRREADLASLQQQQDYLADQTAFSTLTVAIEQPPVEKAEEQVAFTPIAAPPPAGFGGGLVSGWEAFVGFGAGLLLVVGAVLPFAVVVALLAVPAWVLLRRRRAAAPADPAPTAGAAVS
ncbi:DUF4349 domain-containing protein [Nocardioides marinquilinus]|uniref:DUF4349 domain-containing protein n=2 Tax=Nocardioides marinquilinus TaxID=1210400 RepID=A0ABP9PG61_9ACTN